MSRPRLVKGLDAALRHPVTVVAGPPGSGKTVLLREWAQRRASDSRVAWVSLDAGDRSPARFWQAVAAAVDPITPGGPAGSRRAARRSPAGAPPSPATLGEILGSGSSALLVIDQLHEAGGAGLTDAVARLARQLPRTVTMVVGSRAPLHLPLHQARPVDAAVPVGVAHLAFTVDEAGEMFRMVAGRELQHSDMRNLVERMEGWATGLRLAALAIRDGADPAWVAGQFGGGASAVAAYLVAEVLQAEPEHRQRFLMDTALLAELVPPLCDTVTGRNDSARVLADMASYNLFIRPAPTPTRSMTADRTYRYHRAFAAMLQRRITEAAPMEARRVRRRAAGWYRDNGSPRRAVSAFAAAGMPGAARELVSAALSRGLEPGIPGPGDDAEVTLGLPACDGPLDPQSDHAAAAALLRAFLPRAARRWLVRLDASAHEGREEWAPKATLLWALHDAEKADADGVVRRLIRAAPPARPRTSASRSPATGAGSSPRLVRPEAVEETTAASLLARAQVWRGEHGAARDTLQQASPPVDEPDSVVRLGILAMAACGRGHLSEAEALAQECLQRVSPLGGWTPPVVIGVHQALARVRLDRDKLEEAVEALGTASELAARIPDGAVWRADVALDRYDVLRALRRHTDASDELVRIRDIDVHERLPAHLGRRLARAEMRSRLDAGDAMAAAGFLEALPRDRRSVPLVARVELRAGRPDQAARRLRTAAHAHDSTRDEIERLVLLARAELQSGDRRAQGSMRQAVERGRAEGYVRAFVEEGEEAEVLLTSLRGQHSDDYLDLVVHHCRNAAGRAALRSTPTAVIEPLTDREREVLGYLPSHLTQNEIAATMYVSVNTLKTHLKGVYRKLGAESRAGAVRAARFHGLI